MAILHVQWHWSAVGVLWLPCPNVFVSLAVYGCLIKIFVNNLWPLSSHTSGLTLYALLPWCVRPYAAWLCQDYPLPLTLGTDGQAPVHRAVRSYLHVRGTCVNTGFKSYLSRPLTDMQSLSSFVSLVLYAQTAVLGLLGLCIGFILWHISSGLVISATLQTRTGVKFVRSEAELVKKELTNEEAIEVEQSEEITQEEKPKKKISSWRRFLTILHIRRGNYSLSCRCTFFTVSSEKWCTDDVIRRIVQFLTVLCESETAYLFLTKVLLQTVAHCVSKPGNMIPHFLVGCRSFCDNVFSFFLSIQAAHFVIQQYALPSMPHGQSNPDCEQYYMCDSIEK